MFASFFLFSLSLVSRYCRNGHVCFFFFFFGLALLPQWSCLLLLFFFFFSFFYLKGLDVSITQSPWVGTTISIVIHCSHRSVIFHCSSPLPHAFFVLSSIFLASKAKQWHCMLNQSPFPHILFTLYFQFILVFGCVDYIVFMGYFVNNLGFYFVMDLLKIPDPI
jgi:hypothetical protein